MKQLDEIDRKIFSLLKQNAHLSSLEMAEQLDIFAPTVRRRIRMMIKDDIIRIQAIQISRLRSSIQVTIMLKIERDAIAKVADFLAGQAEIEVVILFAGYYDIMIWCYFESVEAYSRFLNNIVYPLKNILEIETHIRTQLRKYAFARYPVVENSMRRAPIHFDDVDTKIVSILEKDAYHNITNLTKTLSISPATARRRLNNLLSNNVIRIQAFPNFHVGKWIAAIILLKLNNDMLNSTADHLADFDEVRSVYVFIGKYDLGVYAWFESIEAFNKFLNEGINLLPGIVDKTVCIQTEIKKWAHK